MKSAFSHWANLEATRDDYFDRQFIPKRDSGGNNIPVRIRCVEMDYMGNFRRPWVILNMDNR